ncbi:MAG: hypothetical protein ABI551_13525 [Polyangiaceae bacterium]
MNASRGTERGQLALFLVISAVFAVEACGGKLAPSEGNSASSNAKDASAPQASGTTSPSSAPSASSDPPSATGDPGGNAYPPVRSGPDDSDCAMRAVRDCCVGDACDSPTAAAQFQTMVHDCFLQVEYCGDAYADFDSEGCAVDLRLGPSASPKYVACLTTLLNAERWSCIAGDPSTRQLQASTRAACTFPRSPR